MNSALQEVHRSPMREYDRRRHRRVDVQLLGRFMLEDRREYPCQTVNMSPGSVALVTPIVGRFGERVVAYIDLIGRVEGNIARFLTDGFAMSINATVHKKDKLAATLMWLTHRHELDLPEGRRQDRMTPKRLTTGVTLPDGRYYNARIIDLSLSGVALTIAVAPPIGSPVVAGNIRGRVARHFEGGIAVEFATLQTVTSVEQNL